MTYKMVVKEEVVAMYQAGYNCPEISELSLTDGTTRATATFVSNQHGIGRGARITKRRNAFGLRCRMSPNIDAPVKLPSRSIPITIR